jgi:DNA repair photolyase
MTHYASPRWTGEILDCSMPMTFDTYSVCSYNCLYCFSFFQRSIGNTKNNYLERNVRHVNINKIKEMFKNPEKSQFGEYIKNKYTMQWGGLSDQFDEYERKYGKTLELLKFFKKINYPLSFSTKSTWFLDDNRYTDIIKGQKNWHFKVSIITNSDEKSKKIELGTDSTTKRLQAINKLHNLDIAGVTLRFRPFIIGISNPEHEKLIERAKQAGADSVSTEFLCLESRVRENGKERYNKISEVAGFDIYEKYKKYSKGTGYLRLNRETKRKFIDEMQKTCKINNMRFYVSDAHFKERCSHGSCCGIPLHMKYNKGQYTEALMIAKKNGYIKFSDFNNDSKKLFDKIYFKNAEGFNTGCSSKRATYNNFTMHDFNRYYWNKPNEKKSPFKYFGGILIPTGKDENGDLVYKYNGDKDE